LFRERLTKEAVHELGHVYGLGHCRDRRRVMAFSNALADTDEKRADFCVRCRKQSKGVRMGDLFLRGTLLQEATDGKVRCHVCERRCALIPGGLGWCRTRENRGGRLVTLTYGAVSSLSANPMEKKPFYHFHPGTFALTAGSWSCNFGCPWCQNWEISKVPPSGRGEYLSPERFVELTMRHGCQGTSISFNEPTLSLEWSLDVFRLARGRGLYNTYVTNGYMTPEALSLLIDAGLDAMNVDVKGDAARCSWGS